MKVVVTGAAGFIGSHVVDRLLLEGHEVYGVDDLSTGSLENLAEARSLRRGRFEFMTMDICQEDLVRYARRISPEVVIHLAAQPSVAYSEKDPFKDASSNVLGTIRVLEASIEARVSNFVYAASGGTLYGEVEENELPVSEEKPFNPLSCYGLSKKQGMEYLALLGRRADMSWWALALSNVYGPRQDPNGEAGVIAIFAGALLRGERPTVFGDGNQTRDFVYVADVVDAFYRAATRRSKGLLVNVGTGMRRSVKEVYEAVRKAVGSELKPKKAPLRPGELRHISLDPSRALLRLGWKPFTGFEEGIKKTVEHLKGAAF